MLCEPVKGMDSLKHQTVMLCIFSEIEPKFSHISGISRGCKGSARTPWVWGKNGQISLLWSHLHTILFVIFQRWQVHLSEIWGISKKESQVSDFTTQWHEHCFKIGDFHIYVLAESLGSFYTICMNKGCKIGCAWYTIQVHVWAEVDGHGWIVVLYHMRVTLPSPPPGYRICKQFKKGFPYQVC